MGGWGGDGGEEGEGGVRQRSPRFAKCLDPHTPSAAGREVIHDVQRSLGHKAKVQRSLASINREFNAAFTFSTGHPPKSVVKSVLEHPLLRVPKSVLNTQLRVLPVSQY